MRLAELHAGFVEFPLLSQCDALRKRLTGGRFGCGLRIGFAHSNESQGGSHCKRAEATPDPRAI
jgi:hypothetical protein